MATMIYGTVVVILIGLTTILPALAYRHNRPSVLHKSSRNSRGVRPVVKEFLRYMEDDYDEETFVPNMDHFSEKEGSCYVSRWSAWTSCSVVCKSSGPGFKTRRRDLHPDCKENLPKEEEGICEGKECPPIPSCNRKVRGPWSKCAGCGRNAYKHMTETTYEQKDDQCLTFEYKRSIRCHRACSKADCHLSDFKPVANLENGKDNWILKRQILSQAKHGGKSCKHFELEKKCEDKFCREICPWSEWTQCNHNHEKKRSKTAENGDPMCSHLTTKSMTLVDTQQCFVEKRNAPELSKTGLKAEKYGMAASSAEHSKVVKGRCALILGMSILAIHLAIP